MNRTYTVYTEWNYTRDPNNSYDHCIISPTHKSELKYDGFNYVGSAGNDGASLDICSDIITAIIQSHFNPAAIEFHNIDRKTKKVVDAFINNCIWTPENGLQLKNS